MSIAMLVVGNRDSPILLSSTSLANDMNQEQIDLFSDYIFKEAKDALSEFGSMSTTWHLIKDGEVYLVSKMIYDEETELEAEEMVKLSVNWLNPDIIIQTAPISLKDKANDKQLEAIAIIHHVPNVNPVASICRVHRASNKQVLFYESLATKQQFDFGGLSFVPFEPLNRQPSQFARQAVQNIFSPNNECLLRVVR